LIRIESTAEGFTVFYRGLPLLRHTAAAPAVAVGRGEGRYEMSHGHFHVRDRLLERRRAQEFRVLESSDQAAVVEFPGLIRLLFDLHQGRLRLRFQDAPAEANRLWLELCATRAEVVYGCGEQFSALQLRGKRVPVWCQEQGVGRSHDAITLYSSVRWGSGGAWHSTYFPMPVFLSTAGWYCFCDVLSYCEFDFRRGDRHALAFRQIPGQILFGRGESLAELVQDLSALIGRQPPMPDWADQGMWLGLQGGKRTVQRKLEAARSAGIEVAALWVQDWVGRRITSFGSQLMWNWRYDEGFYPDLPAYLEELHKERVRFLGYINPFLAIERPLYAEASAAGYCVKSPEGGDFMVVVTDFPTALLDLTNPAARDWIKRIIRENMIGIGLDGWMADYGEYLPPGAVLHSGEPWERVHNEYPVLWARANWEAVAEAGAQDRVTFFMRAGNVGTARYAPAIWAGDQLVSWSRHDGLPTVVPAALSLGLQGVGQFHSDLGGFTTMAWIKRSKELFLRWAELAAFTPIIRTHEGNRPRANWQFDSDRETLTFLARMTRVYRGLRDYRRQTYGDYRERGLPLMRHPLLGYPSDPVLPRLKDQFMLGPDLMVAPVMRPGKTRRRVYLPDDGWIHLWSGQHRLAGWQQEAAPLGTPPVYYRADSSFHNDFEALRRLEGA
jgi:alpha-glucosidase